MIHCCKRFWLLVVCLFMASFVVNAAPVSPDSLITLSKKAFSQKLSLSCDYRDISVKSHTFFQQGNDTVMLITNFDRGFIVLSADDAVSPVLAYSLDDNLDLNDAPPAVQDWLGQYAREISTLKTLPTHPAWKTLSQDVVATRSTDRSQVRPLLTALWNQTRYYNQYSPEDDRSPALYDNRTPNGCVAVAMAMIMYYYRYPLHGTGSHTNYTDYGNFYVNFAQQNYYYEAMEDALDGYNNEVAKLIFHCATAVDMHYAPDGSGAYSATVPDAMYNYFGYQSSISYVSRSNYSNSLWASLLKNELDNKRPIYYSGHGSEGGHAFVCDGYDENGLFHFNFGWGGSSNGYYVLNVSEDSSAVGGFYYWQGAVINCYPGDDNYPYYCNSQVIDCSRGTLEDGSSTNNYLNNVNCTSVIAMENQQSVSIHFQYFDTQLDHDSLSFWDGHPDNGHLLLTLSGAITSAGSYEFQTDSLYVTFVSDDSETGMGWRFSYEVIQNSDYLCSYHIYRTHKGTLNDGSGSYNYLPNSFCAWRIWPYNAQYITLDFSELDISPEDELLIYNSSLTSHSLLLKLTGNTVPEPMTFNCSRIHLIFKSDNYLNGSGFTLSWETDSATSGIDDVSAGAVIIYPNPATDMITIQLPDIMHPASVVLYDIAGRPVRQMLGVSTSCNISVSNLPRGVYLVKCFDDTHVYTRKFVLK